MSLRSGGGGGGGGGDGSEVDGRSPRVSVEVHVDFYRNPWAAAIYLRSVTTTTTTTTTGAQRQRLHPALPCVNQGDFLSTTASTFNILSAMRSLCVPTRPASSYPLLQKQMGLSASVRVSSSRACRLLHRGRGGSCLPWWAAPSPTPGNQPRASLSTPSDTESFRHTGHCPKSNIFGRISVRIRAYIGDRKDA